MSPQSLIATSDGGDPGSGRATSMGLAAILSWATLAWLTTLTRRLPPFETLALALSVAFLAGLLFRAAMRRRPARPGRGAALPFVLATVGIFGFHALFFTSLRLAPPVAASLVNYLWPLLIVLLASRLPGARLRPSHLLGAALGFGGVLLLFAGGGAEGGGLPLAWAGYLCAFGSAMVWAGYSVLNRRLCAGSPTPMVLVCGTVALLGAAASLAFETTIRPDGRELTAILLLGLGPTGGAFFLWDIAAKHGRLALLGALSYLAPLLSTLLLVTVGGQEAGWRTAAACLLIVGGAALASLADLGRPRYS